MKIMIRSGNYGRSVFGAFLMLLACVISAPETRAACAQLDCAEGCCQGSCNGAAGEALVGLCNNNLGACCVIRALPQNDVPIIVDNPLDFNTVEGVLDQTLGTLRAIIGILAIIGIVLGGMLYITAAGDEGRIKTAKGAITAALVGLALGIAAPSFLKQIGDIIGWGGAAAPVATTLAAIATNTLNFLLSVVGVIGIIMLVVGGLLYMTSGGDEKRIETGKSIVKYALIGITVSLAALVIVTQLATFFG
jgi:hypothetical protein